MRQLRRPGANFPTGCYVSWSQSVALEDMLAAARRQLRQQAGQDVQPGANPKPSSRTAATRMILRICALAMTRRLWMPVIPGVFPSPMIRAMQRGPQCRGVQCEEFCAEEFCAEEFCTGDLNAEDPYGDDELLAAELAASGSAPPGTPGSDSAGARVGALHSGASPGGALPVEALAGHARLTPGPVLAAWLSGASPAELDDVALVSSITGWRKVTSWPRPRNSPPWPN